MDISLSKVAERLSRQGSDSDLSSSAESFNLRATSNLVPLQADLNLERGCTERASPLYIGRRLSNARRSAQILPEDVQSIIEHKLDFVSQPELHTGPSEVELLTETQMIPLLIHNEQVERLEKDNRRLSHRLQAAKETKQQQPLERSSLALQAAQAEPLNPGKGGRNIESGQSDESELLQGAYSRISELERVNAEQQQEIVKLEEQRLDLKPLKISQASIRDGEAVAALKLAYSQDIVEHQNDLKRLARERSQDQRLVASLQRELQEQADLKAQLMHSELREESCQRDLANMQEQLRALGQENSSLKVKTMTAQAELSSLEKQCKYLEATLHQASVSEASLLQRRSEVEHSRAESALQPHRSSLEGGVPLLLPYRPGMSDLAQGRSGQTDGLTSQAYPLSSPALIGRPSLPLGNLEGKSPPISLNARPAGLKNSTPSQGIFPDASSRRQSSAGSVTPRVDPKPFATESSLQDFMQKTKQLEDLLMADNREKDLLEGELSRMGSGVRTLMGRNRKAAAEARLSHLSKEIGTIRMQLKRMGALKL